MSIFSPRRQQRNLGDTPQQLVPTRSKSLIGPQPPNPDEAMRHSAVWACLMLRSNIMGSLPVQQFRALPDGTMGLAPTMSPLLQTPGALTPGGPVVRWDEWVSASQIDLDRYGNAFGVIGERDRYGNPTRVDLVDASKVTVNVKNGAVTYTIDRDKYKPDEVWHERQYVVPGTVIGLSPITAAAFALNQGLSAEQFAAQWFAGGGIPSAMLRNTGRTLTQEQALAAKQQVREMVAAGDVLTLGRDWEYQMLTVPANQTQFIEAQHASIADVARYFDVPVEMIGGAGVGGSSITYANITQRNLDFLILHLGPVIRRREAAFTAATPKPFFVKLSTNDLLRMDPMQQAQVIAQRVQSWTLHPDEARAEFYNLPPLTQEQVGLLIAKQSKLTGPEPAEIPTGPEPGDEAPTEGE